MYTSQGRLAALLNDEENNESLSNYNKGRKEDNKERGKVLPEGKDQRGFEKIKNPLGKHSQPPPDNSSDSDEDSQPSRPPIIPPRSNKRPTPSLPSSKSRSKNYHFDLKLNPESVPL